MVDCPRCKGGSYKPFLIETSCGEPCALCDDAKRIYKALATAYAFMDTEDGYLPSILDARQVRYELEDRDE